MSTIVVLGASALQVPLISTARANGHEVVTLDNDLGNVGHRHSTRGQQVSTRDIDGVLAVSGRERPVAVVTCGSDIALPACAHACEALGLPGPDSRVVATWCDKAAFRTHQKEKGLRHPEFVIGSEADALAAAATALDGRLMVKAADRSGSRGITPLPSHSDAGLARAIEHALSASFENVACIEQYIDGTEYGGDCFVENGRITALFVTRKLMDELIVRGHRFPSGLDTTAANAIREELQAHVDAAEYVQGPINFDVRLDSSGTPWLIELAPRLGGNWIPELIEFSTGVNLYSALLANALGDAVDLAADRERPGATYVFGLSGRVTLDKPIDETGMRAALPALFRIEFDYGAGDSVDPMIDSGQQLGRALIDASQSPLSDSIAALETALADVVGRNSVRRLGSQSFKDGRGQAWARANNTPWS